MVTFGSEIDNTVGVASTDPNASIEDGGVLYRRDPNTDMFEYAVGVVIRGLVAGDYTGRWRVFDMTDEDNPVNITAGPNNYVDVTITVAVDNYYLFLLPLDAPISNARTTAHVVNLGNAYDNTMMGWFGNAAAWASANYRGCQRRVSRLVYNALDISWEEDTAQRVTT